ncbi:MAG: hypothetical protein M0T81_05600 [Thermoplasmatales archaeon]|nr:hypothetical protein [Thermoplasmatales archaeon]
MFNRAAMARNLKLFRKENRDLVPPSFPDNYNRLKKVVAFLILH